MFFLMCPFATRAYKYVDSCPFYSQQTEVNEKEKPVSKWSTVNERPQYMAQTNWKKSAYCMI